MRTYLYIFLSILIFTSNVNANTWWQWGWGNWATSSSQAYYEGKAALWRGYGNYLEAVGKYQINNQQAKKLELENRKLKADTVQNQIEQYQAYVNRKYPPYTELKTKALDNAEKHFALKQRESELIKKGVLKPKPATKVVLGGKEFNSYEEYKNSPQYARMLTEARQREAEDDMVRIMQDHLIQAIIRKNMTPTIEDIMGQDFTNRQAVLQGKNSDLQKQNSLIYSKQAEINILLDQIQEIKRK